MSTINIDMRMHWALEEGRKYVHYSHLFIQTYKNLKNKNKLTWEEKMTLAGMRNQCFVRALHEITFCFAILFHSPKLSLPILFGCRKRMLSTYNLLDILLT